MSERVPCTITEVTYDGACAVTEAGDTLYIPLHELSWDRVRGAAEAVAIGDVAHVLVIGRAAKMLWGSLKRTPFQDPWRDPERYQAGDAVGGVTLATPSRHHAFAHLPGGAVAQIVGVSAAELPPGASVRLVLVEVSHPHRTIEARLHDGDARPAQ